MKLDMPRDAAIDAPASGTPATRLAAQLYAVAQRLDTAEVTK